MSQSTFSWSLEAYESRGNLWLRWSTNSPFRAQQGQIHVYNAGFPSDPQKETKAWSWDNENNANWDTGQKWGTGWNCAYIAERSPNGPYTYFIKLTTTSAMGPNVLKAQEAVTEQ